MNITNNCDCGASRSDSEGERLESATLVKDSNYKEHYRLIICVFACATVPKYKDEILKIEETWGKRASQLGVRVLFFLGEEQTDLQDASESFTNVTDSSRSPIRLAPKYIYLKNVKNDYESASSKQNLGLKYIYENYNTDFVYCCGTDTYINIDKLLLYINRFDCNKSLYIGGHGGYRTIGNKNYYYHCGGAGFILSKKCLHSIYLQLFDMLIEWTRICTENNCSDLITASDVSISYFLQNESTSSLEIIIANSLFFSCNYKGVIRHGESTYYYCCNQKIHIPDIISCHCMSLVDFDEYTQLLENNNYWKS